MLDLRFIREHTELVRQGIKAKHEIDNVDKILILDKQRRDLLQEAEVLKAKRNNLSHNLGKQLAQSVMKKSPADLKDALTVLKSDEDIQRDLKEETRKIADKIKKEILVFEKKMNAVDVELEQLLLTVPNIPHSSVPIGATPLDNKEVFSWGEKLSVDFELRPHWDLAEKLGIIDFARGAKVAGAGFPFYVGKGAALERALINFFLDRAAERGYKEISAPLVVNEESARGTGQIPDKEDLMYAAERDGFYLIPTAEVPVTNFHRKELFEEKSLPVHYVAYTPCFRREAGSYGKDVRGLNRLHQFDKVELVKFVLPSKSYEELESLRQDAEHLLQLLGLSYHTLLMCTGDMGFTQTKKYDLEVWAPGQQKWLEVSSCSNFEAFQARRMNIKYKSSETGKQEFVHTLNGSALALPRVLAALLEQYQTPEGKVVLPKVLQPYTKFAVLD